MVTGLPNLMTANVVLNNSESEVSPYGQSQCQKLCLKDVDLSTPEGRALYAADTDKDGFISKEEIIEAMKKHHSQTQGLQRTISYLAVLLLLVVGIGFGLVWLVVYLEKDITTSNSALVDKKTGSVLQVHSFHIVGLPCLLQE